METEDIRDYMDILGASSSPGKIKWKRAWKLGLCSGV